MPKGNKLLYRRKFTTRVRKSHTHQMDTLFKTKCIRNSKIRVEHFSL